MIVLHCKLFLIQVIDMGIEKKIYSFRFELELIEKLQKYAKEENRTLSNMVETILKAYIAEKEASQNK